MIYMDREDLGSQQGMERALEKYFERVKAPDITFNGQLDAALCSCDYEKRVLVLKIEPKPWMANPYGVIHGGVTAAMLDMTMGTLSRYLSGGGMTPTVSMTVNYLRPAPMDRPIWLRAEMTKLGATLSHTIGTAWAEGDEDAPVCTATAVYYTARGKDRP